MSKVDAFLEKLASAKPEGEGGEKKTEVKPEGGVEKTAEELHMEKLANQNETIEAATSLNLAAGYLEKLAGLEGVHEEMKGLLTECSSTLSESSGDMMIGLQKLAAEDVAGMVTDMIDTQHNLYKVATVLNSLADGCEDESFVKMAAEVNGITNKLYDELVELAEGDASVKAYIAQRFGAE